MKYFTYKYIDKNQINIQIILEFKNSTYKEKIKKKNNGQNTIENSFKHKYNKHENLTTNKRENI